MTVRERIVSLLRHGVTVPGTTGGGRSALVLAPMATITHAGYRTLVHEYGGCDLYFTEMISAEALLGGTQFEDHYQSLVPVPEQTVYQVIGYTHESIVAASRRLAARPCAGIDINMGCSAPHLVRKGGGIAWMYTPDKTRQLVETLREAIPDKSISVKLRLGRDDHPDSLVALGRTLVEAGVDFVTLHPKLQKEGDARVARWKYVDLLKEELGVPVIGNGGITGWESYESRRGPVASPRAHALMIGRGAVRAPWLFAYLRGREDGLPDLEVDLAEVTERFLTLLEEHQPEQFWSSRARRFYPYLFENVQFGHSIGARLAGAHDYEEGKRLIRDYFARYPQRRGHTERS